MRILLVVAITVVAPVSAGAECATEATMLREVLVKEARHARIWNAAWAIGFSAAAVGQMALAATETKPFGTFDTDYEEQMYVGTVKASLGAIVRLVMPLRVDVPSAQADACADVVALRAAVTESGRRQRRSFWLTIVGGTLVNLAGAALLWERRNFETGAISFAMGVPVGPISAYTQPRKSWRLWSEQRASWAVGVGGVAGLPRSLWLAGSF